MNDAISKYEQTLTLLQTSQILYKIVKLCYRDEVSGIRIILAPHFHKSIDHLLIYSDYLERARPSESINYDSNHKIKIDLRNEDVEYGEKDICVGKISTASRSQQSTWVPSRIHNCLIRLGAHH